MLRHYENQGLIEAQRSSSRQRLFDPVVADQVRHIRMLLGAGLPLRSISELLDCIRESDRLEPCAVRRAPCAVRRAPCAVRRAPCPYWSSTYATTTLGSPI